MLLGSTLSCHILGHPLFLSTYKAFVSAVETISLPDAGNEQGGRGGKSVSACLPVCLCLSVPVCALFSLSFCGFTQLPVLGVRKLTASWPVWLSSWLEHHRRLPAAEPGLLLPLPLPLRVSPPHHRYVRRRSEGGGDQRMFVRIVIN